MSPHLGADLAALVDGELDHPSRERVLRHLTRCPDCRAEVTEQRCFKTRLRGLTETAPAPAADLAARLRAVAAQPDDAGAGPDADVLFLSRTRTSRATRPPAVAAPRSPSTPRSPITSGSPATPRSPRRPAGRRRLPRGAVGGAVLALGLGAVLALSGPQRGPVRTPVDPAGDAVLVDVASTSELPLPKPAGVTSAGLGR
ncbi:MAG TPA: zf-HC2 domain-containing protein [Mycobacteriales bacterium]|jgi:anti-sigma factor RsiW|nr:zf-HC2 domain-containing protein [Mycobacteriales bacterium]